MVPAPQEAGPGKSLNAERATDAERATRPQAVASLIEPFLMPQVAKRTDIRQAEREAEQILVAHIGDGVAAIFQRHPAAIPVVGGLGGRELELSRLRIDAEAAGGTEPTAD